MRQDIFINRLKQLIEATGCSQMEFANRAGIPSPTLYRYLNGSRMPTLEVLFKITDFTGCTLDWLFGTSNRQYLDLPEELRELVDLYQCAAEQDKAVVKLLLSRYKAESSPEAEASAAE